MKSFLKLALATFCLAGWALAALSLHVIRTDSGVQLISKNKLSIEDTYVDIRHWTSDDEDKHPAFYARLKQLDQTDLLQSASEEHESVSEEPKSSASARAGISDAWFRVSSSNYHLTHR